MNKKRAELLITWDGVKFRHPGISIRDEWDKYVKWKLRKEGCAPVASISSILYFEEQWLKSNNVTRINNQKSYLPAYKHVSEDDINEALDIFQMRNINTTKEEVKALMTDGATLASIEMWFSSGILPRSPLLKMFIAGKGIK